MKQLSIIAFILMFGIINIFSQEKATLTVKNNDTTLLISRHIYGHFSEHLGRCIYDGFWVNENSNIPNKDRIRTDIVEALKKIHIPNLRWPGGCFADEYHWRDGIGPRAQRPKMVNTNWGGVTEDNSFGTHEFLELCGLLHCEPYITGNVGSGTVEEMSKWIEYLNFNGESPMTNLRKQNGHPLPYNVKFWGVGNESWGCGGQMSPEHYAEEYKQYGAFAKSYQNSKLLKIASGANSADYNWTEVCMKQMGKHVWGLSLHYYVVPTGNWKSKGSATAFDQTEYFNTMKSCLFMDSLIIKHSAIMDKYDARKNIGLVVDEWGIWTDVEPGTNPGFLYQQNSLRDALIAASTLNIFNNHCDRVKMANLAQTVNVLQALVLTNKEKMLLTPTYHIFDLYQVHQDAQYLPIDLNTPDYTSGDQKIPAVNASASRDSLGVVHISLVNLYPDKPVVIQTSLKNIKWKTVTGQILTSGKLTDINTFEKPDNIHISLFIGAKKKGDDLVVELPAKSVVVLELK
jgi:alpha-L-arabinofuranosidase